MDQDFGFEIFATQCHKDMLVISSKSLYILCLGQWFILSQFLLNVKYGLWLTFTVYRHCSLKRLPSFHQIAFAPLSKISYYHVCVDPFLHSVSCSIDQYLCHLSLIIYILFCSVLFASGTVSLAHLCKNKCFFKQEGFHS